MARKQVPFPSMVLFIIAVYSFNGTPSHGFDFSTEWVSVSWYLGYGLAWLVLQNFGTYLAKGWCSVTIGNFEFFIFFFVFLL